jgi:hypothetical protein
MESQQGDDKAEQKSGSEEHKGETPQLRKFQRDKLLGTLLAPSNLLGVIQTYLLFVTAVVGFGVLAFYTGHKITQEVAFYASIPLFLAIPTAVFWFLRPKYLNTTTDKTKLKGQRPLSRVANSTFGKFLVGTVNSNIYTAFWLAYLIWRIVRTVRDFPLHPRLSLALVAYYMAVAFLIVAFRVVDTFADWILDVYKTIGRVIDIANENVDSIEKHLRNANTVSNVVADLWIAEEKRKTQAAAESSDVRIGDAELPIRTVSPPEQPEFESPEKPDHPEKLLGP